MATNANIQSSTLVMTSETISALATSKSSMMANQMSTVKFTKESSTQKEFPTTLNDGKLLKMCKRYT